MIKSWHDISLPECKASARGRAPHVCLQFRPDSAPCLHTIGEGELDAVGNPHRAQISRFDLVELILLKLDRRFPVEPFEATVSQSTVPCPPLDLTFGF